MQCDAEKIEAALWHCDCNDRDAWITCGMAVKDELGEAGFDLWDAWSANSPKYKSRIAQVTWRSFRRSGVTAASLYKLAMEGGWRPAQSDSRPSAADIAAREERRRQEAAARDAMHLAGMERAAKKAAWIMHQAKPERHAYLHAKGFEAATGPVWWPDEGNNLLCIPMRYREGLCGVQMVSRQGAKKFLAGQRTSHAEYVIDNSGVGARHWWVEGYATGLSLREALKFLRLRYVIHITFSASNLRAMAHSGVVVADHDESGTGERAAVETGLPYYLPPPGDFNDLHKREGTVRAALLLQQWLKGNG